jgi:membrane protein implicated in regulation of membrane protease activity
MEYRRIVVSPPGWRGKLALVVGVALALGLAAALIVLAAAVAIVILPVVAVASLFGWWRWKRATTGSRTAAGDDGRTIEIDYRVIDDRR